MPTDMRSLVPAETLVYLETNDLAAALQPIVDSKPFTEIAMSKPDFSALKGVQVAVAVTGFETTEIALTDEHSVGKVQPRFVAIADTHAWNFQAVGFAEQKLGSFVAEIYNSEPTLEKIDKNGGKYFIWTAADGRKAYALVIGSLIYFSNDETAIDKCLAVKNGEADSILKTGKIQPSAPDLLASGYVSTDGVAQIANIAGMKFASEIVEDPDAQSAIAAIVPQLIRGTITEVSWNATQTSDGIEDKWEVTMPSDAAGIFVETFAAQDESPIVTSQRNEFIAQLPENVVAVTHYNLKNPQLAWRSFMLTEAKNLDPISAKIFLEFSSLFFEPYGIRDPELFLSSFGDPRFASRSIVTAKLDDQSEGSVAVLATGDDQSQTKALSHDLKPPRQVVEGGENTWADDEEDLQIVFGVQITKIGQKKDLERIRGMNNGELSEIKGDLLRRVATSKAPITSAGRESSLALALVAILASEGHGDVHPVSTYLTETRFTTTGMERRTVSDFGFIGWMIAQMAQD